MSETLLHIQPAFDLGDAGIQPADPLAVFNGAGGNVVGDLFDFVMRVRGPAGLPLLTDGRSVAPKLD